MLWLLLLLLLLRTSSSCCARVHIMDMKFRRQGIRHFASKFERDFFVKRGIHAMLSMTTQETIPRMTTMHDPDGTCNAAVILMVLLVLFD
jgi:hypothetical protein